MSNPYAKEYKKEDPMVERHKTTQRVGGPNTRLQRRVHGRYLDYGPMPHGYERSHKAYAKYMKTQKAKTGKTGGTRRRGRKTRSTRRR